jgi:sugar lactone lactonase YvrE
MVSILSIFVFCFPSTVLSESFRQIFLPPTGFGPESLAFESPGGAFYTGVNDGRVLRYQLWYRGPICGRPLGLAYSPFTKLLYIADAYYGLFVADSNGRLAKQIANSAEGQRFVACNALDTDPITGNIYFTDASAVYDLRSSVNLH